MSVLYWKYVKPTRGARTASACATYEIRKEEHANVISKCKQRGADEEQQEGDQQRELVALWCIRQHYRNSNVNQKERGERERERSRRTGLCYGGTDACGYTDASIEEANGDGAVFPDGETRAGKLDVQHLLRAPHHGTKCL